MFKEGLLSVMPTAIVGLFLFYLVCKGTDFGTGLLKTLKNKNSFKSRKMRDGVVRWMAEFIALVFVMALDMLLGLNFLISGATLGLFIYKEVGSILENLGECGVMLPNIIKDKLEVFNPNKEEMREQE